MQHLLSEWQVGGKYTFSFGQGVLSALGRSLLPRSNSSSLCFLEGEDVICACRGLDASNGEGTTT